MLIGLLLQITLTIIGERRKYTVGFGGDLLWLSYLSADSVAIFSLGILARSVVNSTNPNLIPVFWAPILVVHIGGPGTISAYSMHELDKLLINHLLQLVTRVGVVGYVLFRLRENAFMLVAIPIFISGMIKYGARNWVLKRNKESSNLSQQPFAKRSCIHVKDIISITASSSEVRYLNEAHLLFITSYKMLFHNRDLVDFDQRITYGLVSEKKAEEAFQLTEIEQGLKYDRLYSKVATVSWPRFILRSVTFLSSIFALVSFSIMIKSKSVYSKNDRIISYVLLSGVVCLESYSIIGHLLSDWTRIWLSSWKNGSLNLYRTRCLSMLLFFSRKPKRWSRLMGQHNLVSALSKKPVNKLRKKYFPGNWKVDSREKVDKDLKELIFKQILDKRSRYDPDATDFLNLLNLLEERGYNSLRSKDCFDKLGWSVNGVEFSHSLLTWHIATHVCYIDDSKKNGFAKRERRKGLTTSPICFFVPSSLSTRQPPVSRGSAYLSSPDLFCFLLPTDRATPTAKPTSQPPSPPSSTQQSRQPLVKEKKKVKPKGKKKSRSDPLAAWFFLLRLVNPQAASGGGGWSKRAATVPETHKIPARSESKQLVS